MENLTQDLLEKLNDIKTVWLRSEVVPDDLADWGIPRLNKDRVAYTLDECGQLLTKLQSLDWQGPVALAVNQSEAHISELSNFVSTRLTQPNPQQDANSFLSHLHALLLDLRGAAVFSTDTVYNAERELLRVTSQIESSKAILQNLSKITEEANSMKSQTEVSVTKITASEKAAVEIQEKLTTVSATVTPIETQIKDLLAKADQQVTQIAKHKEEIIQLNKNYMELEEKGTKEATNLEKLRKRCEEQQEEIHKTIEDANRLGMAGSFRMRKDELVRPMIIWGVSFLLGVASLTFLAWDKILPLLEQPQQLDWLALLGRLPLVGPSLWFSWLSVKQFGYNARLWEDYAFKYASAMAFEGYKREATSVSPEMLKLLMEISIVNFANNPLRVYDSKTNHGSPLSELTSDSKGLLQRLLDVAKAFVSSDKK